MRRLILLAVLALGLAACGGGSGAPTDSVKIVLGVNGGLILPYTITIAPGGKVTSIGHPPTPPTALSSADDVRLSGLVRDGIGKLKSLQCAHTLADVGSLFITAAGKTVEVRGDCEPGFTTLWDALTGALKLNQ